MSQNDTHETLFTELRILGARVADLAGCVQNDINWMKRKGHVTKKDLEKTLPEIDRQFNRAKKDLNTLHERVTAYYRHQIANFD